MNLVKTPIIYILLFVAGTTLSCQDDDKLEPPSNNTAEDSTESSENNNASNFSGKLWDIDAPGVYSVQWSDLRDEIVVLTWTGVVVIDIKTKAVRKVEFVVGRELPISWLVGDTLYFVNYKAQLGAINVSTLAYTPTVADASSLTQKSLCTVLALPMPKVVMGAQTLIKYSSMIFRPEMKPPSQQAYR